MVVNTVLALALGYIIGAFPTAFLVGKLKGQNIFKVGSGNMGAMNTARNLGYGLGILVLLLDLAKGALVTYLGIKLFAPDVVPAYIAAIGAVLGHAWSIYIRFKGGKGLATGFGAALPLYAVGGLATLILLLVFMAITKRVNLASFMVAVLYPVTNAIVGYWQHTASLWPLVLSTLVIGLIVAIKHIPSLKIEAQKTKR
jgi:acyl phosphate:glycerol-3-phosphate acyltransferase